MARAAAIPSASERSPGLSNRQKAAEQLDNRFDAGDFYLTPKGERHLSRLAGSIMIRFEPQVQKLDGLSRLTTAGGPLQSYTLDLDSSKGFLLLKAPQAERHLQRSQPGRLQQAIDMARRLPGIRSANPVFIEPETGLARVPTSEILIRLKPPTDPQSYFGESWLGVKRLTGTRDHFLLPCPIDTAEELLAEANRRAADPRVLWAQPNFISQVIQETSDPLFSQQWPFSNQGVNGALPGADVNAPRAWADSIGSPGIVIAVLDDGVQLDHPDLSANIFSNPGESLNGVDDDANGYVDDLHGWDFYRDDNDPSPELPEDRHGTATAGVAAAGGDNNTGVAGVAYGCQIMPLKVIGGNHWASDSGIAEAVYYAAGRTRDGLGRWRGADIINLSLTLPQSDVVDTALAWAAANGRVGKGCPIFAAAGDDASRWRPTRVRLPVGAMNGPGRFRFGFEYAKDVGSSAGEDLVKIDNVALLGSDGVTQLDSPLGPEGRQDFEEIFPPSGWQLSSSSGAPPWIATTDKALLGTRGSISAQSGPIGRNQWTELRTPVLTISDADILSFSCYISSEPDFDGLRIWVYDENDQYLTVLEAPLGLPLISGNPSVSTSIHYPASHPGVMAVGASTDADVRSDYSQSGPGLEFLAPSSGGWNDVITTDWSGTNGYTDGDYVYDFGGTSAACALGAGVGALVLSVNPSLTAADVRALLRNSCDKIAPAYDEDGWNSGYGYGRLNAQLAVANAKAATKVAIEGAVHYYPPGYPANGASSAPPISGATLLLADGEDQSIQTASDGSYSFSIRAGDNATVTPDLANNPPPVSGITTLDISMIRQYVLQATGLDSPYQLLAADVNGSRSVTTLDIAWMRKMILGVVNTFPAGRWRCVPSDYVFPDPENPWDAPDSRSYTNLLSDASGQDFLAIELGDVNASWRPAAGSMAAPVKKAKAALSANVTGPEVVFQVSHHTNQPGENVVAQVSVSSFREVTSAQFTLAWDPAVLRYEGIGDYGVLGLSPANFGTLLTNRGAVAFSWDDPQAVGVTLEDGTSVFSVDFAVIGTAGNVSPLELVDTVAQREVGVNFASATLRAENGEVTVGAQGLPQVSSVKLSNPAYRNGAFSLSLPTVGGLHYILEFTDVLPGTNWTALPAIIGDGAVKTLTDSSPATQQRFYRLRLE